MCGRFTLTATDGLVEEFSLATVPLASSPRYNVAPTQPVATIVNREPRTIELMRWGLIPSWAGIAATSAPMINARSETIATKPAFRDAYSRRRCLIVADGFFEWKSAGKSKTPFYFCRPDRALFGFAGLWAVGESSDGQRLCSCAIITCAADDVVSHVHHRMPVIVHRDDYDRWLCADALPPDALADIVSGGASGALEASEVSAIVNSARNDVPACVEPPAQRSLF